MRLALLCVLSYLALSLPFLPMHGAPSPAFEHTNERRDVSFIARREFPSGQGPVSVATADFNHDGHADLAVANSRDDTVSILRGRTDGSFQPPSIVSVGRSPQAVRVGDFNGDHHPDLAVLNILDDTISILLGYDDAKFMPAPVLKTDRDAVQLEIADFNGDEQLDLAVLISPRFQPDTPPVPGSVFIFLGHGDGTFGAVAPVALAPIPRSLVVGDVNGDRRSDLAVLSFGMISTLLGKGDGTFQPAPATLIGRNTVALALADFNKDRNLDLAVVGAQSTLPPSQGTAQVLLGVGDGTFQPAPAISLDITVTVSVAVGDFNNDTYPDIAITSFTDSRVTILLSQGDGTLKPMPPLSVGRFPLSVAVSDFNRDGRLDITTISQESNTVSILLGQGDGTFESAPELIVGQVADSVAAGDLNGDGHLDLVATDFEARAVAVQLGLGDGTFQTLGPIAVDYPPSNIGIGHFNDDEYLDLALTNPGTGGGNTVSILLGRGDGTFQAAPTQIVGSAPTGVDVGDFNHDGRDDLVVSNDLSASVSILLSTGDGTFQQAITVPVGTNPLVVKVADYNGDGHQDLVVTSTNPNSEPPGSLVILLGRGDGTFQEAPEVRLNVFPVSLAVADLNGDGRLDIVVGNQLVSPALSILLGRGDGTFQAGPVVPIPRLQMGINGVLAADFNRDGRTDLAIATSNYVLILLGQGDATFKTSLLAGVGNSPRSVTTGDFNGDGFPDLATGNYEAGTVSVLINNSAARHCQNRTNRYSVERDSDELLANRERDVLAHTLHRCRPLP